MEQIHDLLSDKQAAKLDVRQGEGGSHLPGLTEVRVVGVEQAWTYLKRGQQHRAAAATSMNAESSRSHCLLCLRVHGRSKLSGAVLPPPGASQLGSCKDACSMAFWPFLSS